MFRSWVARKYGGLESHPLALYEAIEQVSYFEGSMGWVVMVCGTSARLSGLLPAHFADEIFGDPRAVAGGFVGAMGAARAVPGGVTVSGRWPWGSGTPHCTYVAGGTRIVNETGEPAELPDDTKSLLVIFERGQVELSDNWDTGGLRASASGDYIVNDVFVPAGRWLRSLADRPTIDAPLYRFAPVGSLAAGVAFVCLGLGQRPG